MPDLHGSPGALGPDSGFPGVMDWRGGGSGRAPIPADTASGWPGRDGYPKGPVFGAQRKPERLHGLIQFVPTLLRLWRLKDEDATSLLGFNREDATHVALALRGREPFRGRDVRERIAHLVWIRTTLSALFRDLEVENAWLREPHRWLDDRIPMDLLLDGSIEDVLLVRDYVDTAAGA